MKKILLFMLLSSVLGLAQVTPNLGLSIPLKGTLNWDVQANGNFSMLDSLLSGGSNLKGLSLSSAGVFTAAQMNENFVTTLNGCSTSVENQAAQGSSNFSTNGFSSCVSQPSSALVNWTNAIAGYATALATVSNVSTRAGYFQCRVLSNDSTCEGFEAHVQDVSGLTPASGVQLLPVVVVTHAFNGSSVYEDVDGIQSVGIFDSGTVTGSRSGANAYRASVTSTSSPWINSFRSEDNTATYVISAGAACKTGNCSSQGIQLNGMNAGVDTSPAYYFVDSGGNPTVTGPSGSVALRIGAPSRTFSTYPACSSGIEGSFAVITDSTTVVWGATITGSGANHVLGYCDGTNWTVAAK